MASNPRQRVGLDLYTHCLQLVVFLYESQKKNCDSDCVQIMCKENSTINCTKCLFSLILHKNSQLFSETAKTTCLSVALGIKYTIK